jgi:hypothetical protein
MATLQGLAGRYAGGRSVVLRDGKLFYRRADGAERELVPLARDLFALDEIGSSQRMKFKRTNGVVTGAAFVTATGLEDNIAREGP